MELLVASAVKCGVEAKYLNQIMECVTTEEALRILSGCGKQQVVMNYVMERICYYLNRRTKGKMKIDCIMYANEFGELAKSKEALEWFSLLEQEQEQ